MVKISKCFYRTQKFLLNLPYSASLFLPLPGFPIPTAFPSESSDAVFKFTLQNHIREEAQPEGENRRHIPGMTTNIPLTQKLTDISISRFAS